MKNPWTPSDSQTLRRLVASGLTDGQIAERMGRCRGVIREKRAKSGMLPGQSEAMTAALRRIRAMQRARA